MGSAAFAGSFEMISPADTTVTGDIQEVSQLECEVNFKNISANDLNVNVKAEVISITSGHTYAICYGEEGTCYPRQTSSWVCPATLKISAGSLIPANKFVTYCYPSDGVNDPVQGKTVIKYTFYNTADASDFVTYTVNFEYKNGSGVNEIESEQYTYTLDDAWPNPAKDIVNINYTVCDCAPSPMIKVYALNGDELDSKAISWKEKSVQFNTASYNPGTYIYVMEINGEQKKTKKFIISR